jgi:hypothetical protein
MRISGLLLSGALGVALTAGTLMATTVGASADIVCNRYDECWHVSQRYTTYPSTLGVVFYDDDWRTAHLKDVRYHWRDDQTDDHGYYMNGEWHTFTVTVPVKHDDNDDH